MGTGLCKMPHRPADDYNHTNQIPQQLQLISLSLSRYIYIMGEILEKKVSIEPGHA